jgi:phosphoglycerate dehydrogenase-like enzyme
MHIAIWLTHPDVDAWRFKPHHAARLREALPSATITVCHYRDDFLEALPSATMAVVWRFKQEWFYLAPELKFLATPSAGRDYFSVQPPEGVTQWYGAFQGPLMAETVLAMALAAHRGLLHAAQWMRSGDQRWPRTELEPLQRAIRGSHAIILGFGSIGRAIAEIMKPLGIRITGIRRSNLNQRPSSFDADDALASPDDLQALLPSADTLICCLPASPETNHIIGRDQLMALPPHAVVINVGRGNAIHEQALIHCLQEGHLGAACLDVFREEPLPLESPLRTTTRCYLMPHASAVAPTYLDLYLDELIPRCLSSMHHPVASGGPPRP